MNPVGTMTEQATTTIERLIDENGSLVLIIRAWVPKDYATALCEKFKTTLAWKQEEVKMFGKLVLEPRRVYACGEEGIVHKYAGKAMELHPWVSEVKEFCDIIEKDTGIKNNACLLNEYATGANYIGWHSDAEVNVANNYSVVTISLGGSRDFYFKRKVPIMEGPNEPRTNTIKTTLHNGDVVIMTGQTQKQFTHSIPKRAHGEYRISLTYRYLL